MVQNYPNVSGVYTMESSFPAGDKVFCYGYICVESKCSDNWQPQRDLNTSFLFL